MTEFVQTVTSWAKDETARAQAMAELCGSAGFHCTPDVRTHADTIRDHCDRVKRYIVAAVETERDPKWRDRFFRLAEVSMRVVDDSKKAITELCPNPEQVLHNLTQNGHTATETSA